MTARARAAAALTSTRRALIGGGATLLGSALLAPNALLATARGDALFDVRRYGAKGDGRTIDSPAINRAIEAAAARGGGTIYLPAGTYLSYTIRLKSRITLELAPGAVLLAATVPPEAASGGYDEADPIDPAIAKFQDFGHSHWRNALIWGDGLTDIAIVGGGLIWGKGLTDGYPTDGYRVGDGRPGVANKVFGLKNCRNVLLRDFRVLQGGWFTLLATGVDNMTIDNVLVDTLRDGFDIDCCRNVRVTNCVLNTPHDDAIVPKSSYALGYSRVTENVSISNCTVSGNYVVGSVLDGTFKRLPPGETMKIGRIKLGTESNGGFRNITVTNCLFDQCRGIALETVDGGALEDVAISNITMRGCTNAPLFLRLASRLRGPAGTPVGTLKRVSISNVISSGASPMPSIIAGIEGHMIEDVRIADCYFQQVGGGSSELAAREPPEADKAYPETELFGELPANGLFVRHARNIELDHVEFAMAAPDARSAVWLSDVDRFTADGVSTAQGAGRRYHLDRVRQFRLLGQPEGAIELSGPVSRKL